MRSDALACSPLRRITSSIETTFPIFYGIRMEERTCEAKLPPINGNVARHLETSWTKELYLLMGWKTSCHEPACAPAARWVATPCRAMWRCLAGAGVQGVARPCTCPRQQPRPARWAVAGAIHAVQGRTAQAWRSSGSSVPWPEKSAGVTSLTYLTP